MLTALFEILELGSFVALMTSLWRVSKWPRWRVRVIVYGWALVFLWALFWAVLLPAILHNSLDKPTSAAAFPDGTIAAAALFAGWFWPAVIACVTGYFERKKPQNRDRGE